MTNEQTSQQQTKPSSAITALSVCVLVFAVIGLLASFIPCFGMLAIYISIPTAIVGIITAIAAKKTNAPRGLAVTGLVIALIAFGIAIAQYSALDSANKKLEQKNRALWRQ